MNKLIIEDIEYELILVDSPYFSYMDDDVMPVKEKSITLKGKFYAFIPLKKNEVESWIDNWLRLFPSGVKSGGKLLRSDRQGCLKKMKKFMQENDFSIDVIMKATKAYLDERATENYMYTKCSTYLISKEKEGSELAALCANYTEKKETKQDYTINNDLI